MGPGADAFMDESEVPDDAPMDIDEELQRLEQRK
jgi:hypothetical protein